MQHGLSEVYLLCIELEGRAVASRRRSWRPRRKGNSTRLPASAVCGRKNAASQPCSASPTLLTAPCPQWPDLPGNEDVPWPPRLLSPSKFENSRIFKESISPSTSRSWSSNWTSVGVLSQVQEVLIFAPASRQDQSARPCRCQNFEIPLSEVPRFSVIFFRTLNFTSSMIRSPMILAVEPLALYRLTSFFY